MMKLEFNAITHSKAYKCPMCHAENAEQVIYISGCKFISTNLELMECSQCGTFYYSNSNLVVGCDSTSFNEDYWHNYVQNGASITAMLEPLLGICGESTGNLINIGCGFGFVPHYWTKMGYGTAIGLETSYYGRIGAEKLGIEIHNSNYHASEDLKDKRFDYVLCSEVLEHTEDPKSFVDEISAALSPSGILVLTTPSASCIRLGTEHADLLAALSPGFHYFITTKQALHELLKRCGFKHILIHDTGSRLLAWASCERLPEIKVGFNKWDEYLDYLQALIEHADLHIAGGAAYRLLKDSVNLGQWHRAVLSYSRLLEISKLQYGIDLEQFCEVDMWKRACATSDYSQTPSWLGCALLFCGLVQKEQAIPCERLERTFYAAAQIMQHEIEVSDQSSKESAHFIKRAREEYHSAVKANKAKVLSFRHQNLPASISCLLDELDETPNSPGLYHRLGVELKKSGQMEIGETALKEACRLAPTNTLYHATRGVALMETEKFGEAYACLRYALNCSPQDRTLHALIASASLALGANAVAEYHAQRALNDDQGAPLETDALARTILSTARFRNGNGATVSDFSVLASNPNEQVKLRAQRELEIGNFESGLFELASLINEDIDDKSTRLDFMHALLRFKSESEGSRFDDFVSALALDPLPAEQTPESSLVGPSVASIDIIIPVYNAVEDLKSCLESIRKWSSKSMRHIILVDDASNAETGMWMKQEADRYSDIQVIRNSTNLGFTRSVMVGMRHSESAYAIMLNSDTIVTNGWLDGLWQAMNKRGNIALAGPLTNNSYFQSIQPDGIDASTLADNPDLLAALVLTQSRNIVPVVPLLSGFCLLVRRDAFDQVGGLDEEGFPWGYWEVQDLCLKLKDVGFEAVIADNVYVHHSGSKSIASARKKLLISQGLKLIHERYSTLRFQVAEALCAVEPVIWQARQAWGELAKRRKKTIQNDNQRSGPVERTATTKVIKRPKPAKVDEETCLFVSHAPFGTALEYTISYIKELRKCGIRVILCLTTDTLTMPVDPAVIAIADGLIVRQNEGYDFGAWADVLRIFPDAWRAKRLYFVNDSIIGPFVPLAEVISKIRSANAGFFSLSECTFGGWHAQSFFFGWAQKNLQAQGLRKFWSEVTIEVDKLPVINKYERNILKLSADLPDPSSSIIFGMNTIFGSHPVEICGVNPTHQAWRRLLAAGFPFVKTDLLRDNLGYVDTTDWESICASYGADVSAIHRHIEQSRLNRLLNKSLW